MSMENIDRELTLDRGCWAETIGLSAVEDTTQHKDDICQSLSDIHHEFLNVFDRSPLLTGEDCTFTHSTSIPSM